MNSTPRELPAGYGIREAAENDLDAVIDLLRPFVERRQVMRRTRNESAALLSTGFVAEHQNCVVAFSSVEIYSKKLAEIQCLAVSEEHRKHGIGGLLVQRCVALAESRGVMEVMAISSSERFLRELGFDYSLPNQKRALFYSLRSRDEVYHDLGRNNEGHGNSQKEHEEHESRKEDEECPE